MKINENKQKSKIIFFEIIKKIIIIIEELFFFKVKVNKNINEIK